MKNISLLYIVLYLLQFPSLTKAQNIPNGSFEDWIIGGGPDLWYTNNQYWPPVECLQIFPDFQAYSGEICALGVVDSCIDLSLLYPPILSSFDISLNAKPEALHGFYKYLPQGNDLFYVRIKLFADSVLIGEGSFKSEQLVNEFTKFVVNFEYFSTDIPDIAIIEFTIDSSLVDNKLHQGSKWYLDSLTFGPLSDIGDEDKKFPLTFSLYQNYPNPFNPITKIKFTIPTLPVRQAGSPLNPSPYQGEGNRERFITLKVYDVLGNEIATLVKEEKPAGTYEIEFTAGQSGSAGLPVLPSGVYFYQLRAGDPKSSSGQGFVETKKMILLK